VSLAWMVARSSSAKLRSRSLETRPSDSSSRLWLARNSRA